MAALDERERNCHDRHYPRDVYLGGPPWLYAFILAVVAGVLLAIGEYVGGGIAAALAVALMAAWQRASPEDRRGGLS
jgi:hypothetical protein